MSTGTEFLTAEEGPVVPVGGGQLADVLGAVAHDPGEVARVAQAAHDDAVQVHGLDEVAEQRALQAQHVPPAGRGCQRGQWGGGTPPSPPAVLATPACPPLPPLAGRTRPPPAPDHHQPAPLHGPGALSGRLRPEVL